MQKCEGLVAVWLSGSFARGEATPVSDVDLADLAAVNPREVEEVGRWLDRQTRRGAGG